MFADKCLTVSPQKASQHERDDQSVIKLSGDRDEVRYEVEGEREVAREQDEERLLAARHTRIAEQATAKHDAVWDEPCERTGALALPSDHKREDERGVEEKENTDADE